MHRSAEIWEKRHERLDAILAAKSVQFGEARKSPSWDAACEASRAAWQRRYNAIERRVWKALCVAKGWRKA